MQLRSSKRIDPDILRLTSLKKEYKIATSQDAQWAMMYFLEDNTHTIRQLLKQLNTKYKDSMLYPFTFPGISEDDVDDDV